MAGGGYDIGAGFSSSSPSASSSNSPFNVQGGGGSLQIFGMGSNAPGASTAGNPKTTLYVVGALAVAAVILLFIILRR